MILLPGKKAISMGSSSPSASTTFVKRFQSGGVGLSAKKPNHAKMLKNKVEKILIIEKVD
jgi:hypothetical protein